MEMLEKGSVPTPLDTLENFLEVIKSIYLKNRQNRKSLDELYEKMPVPIPQVKLVQCKYNNDSNLIGALANYKKVY